MTTFLINGIAVENIAGTSGLLVSDGGGWLDVPVKTYNSQQVLLRDGSVPQSSATYTAPRDFMMTFYLQPSSLGNRRTQLRAIYQALRGRLAISTVEDPTTCVYGYLLQAPVTKTSAWLYAGQPQVTVKVTLRCFDPLWYDINPQILAINAINTPKVLPVGTTLTRRVKIVLFGTVASSPVVLTLASGYGDAIQTNTLSLTLTSAQSLTIDCDAYTIIKSDGTSQISALGSTETFFALDPNDQPMLSISEGTAVVYVWRAYDA